MEKRDWPLFVYGGVSSCIAELSKILFYIFFPTIKYNEKENN